MSELQIPEGWELKKLGDICSKITDGEHFRPQTQNLGVPFLSAKDILEDGPNFDNCLYVSETDSKKFRKRCNPEKNDILMVSRGATIGRTCINNHEEIFCLLGSVILIKLNSEVFPNYALYALKSNFLKNQLLDLSGSSAQPAIYLKDLKSLELILPPLEIQKQIVAKLEHILGQLEEKKKQILTIIENNKQRIDFFEKNWLSYVIDTEIEHHPERKNWESFPLKEITTSIGDGLHSTPNYTDSSNYYFINGNNLQNGSIVITSKTKMVNRDEYEKYKLELDENTVLLSINGTIGNLSFYRNENVILGKSACYINCKDSLIPEFLFYLLKSNYIKNYFTSELTKTSIPNLSLK